MPVPKGIDVRQSGGTVLVRVGIDDSGGNALATGTAALRVLEWQADGTTKQLDFASNTFKTSALTTATTALTAQTAADTTVTGLWSAVLTSTNLTNFTVGGIYVVVVTHSAIPGVTIRREWQYGSTEGDLATDVEAAMTTQGYNAARSVTIDGITTILSIITHSQVGGTVVTDGAANSATSIVIAGLPTNITPAVLATGWQCGVIDGTTGTVKGGRPIVAATAATGTNIRVTFPDVGLGFTPSSTAPADTVILWPRG